MQVFNNSDIATLVHFNFWADNHILTTSDRISVREFTRLYVPDPGWASLRGILVHTLDTEYGWRPVLQELDADEILGVDDFPTVAVLKSQWDIERAAWINYVAGMSTERLNLGYGMIPKMAQRCGRRSCTLLPTAFSIEVKPQRS